MFCIGFQAFVPTYTLCASMIAIAIHSTTFFTVSTRCVSKSRTSRVGGSDNEVAGISRFSRYAFVREGELSSYSSIVAFKLESVSGVGVTVGRAP